MSNTTFNPPSPAHLEPERRMFAAMFMQGMLANSTINMNHSLTLHFLTSLVEDSVTIADALIAELNKPRP